LEINQRAELQHRGQIKSGVNINIATLELLLHSKNIGNSLVSSRPLPVDGLATTGVSERDEPLGGGLARGHFSEIIGPPSSRRTSVLIVVLAERLGARQART
jgi:hypothetical protein